MYTKYDAYIDTQFFFKYRKDIKWKFMDKFFQFKLHDFRILHMKTSDPDHVIPSRPPPHP